MRRAFEWMVRVDALLLVIAVGSLPTSNVKGSKVRRECDYEGCSLGTVKYGNGAKYVGQLKQGKPHGHGTLAWANGDQYIGDWKDDRRHGHGAFAWANGRRYVGDWNDGKKHGQGTHTWPNGDQYVGDWKESTKTGSGTYTWQDGRKYIGQWLGDKKHGQGTLIWPDTAKYIGEWNDDKMHGQGTDTKPGVLWGESRQQGLWVNNAFIKSHEQEAAEVEQAQVASFSERHPAPPKRRLKRGCENWLKGWQEDYEALLELVHAGKYSVLSNLLHAYNVGKQLRTINAQLKQHLQENVDVKRHCDPKVLEAVSTIHQEWHASVELGVHLWGPFYFDPASPMIWFKSANFTLVGTILTGMLTILTGVFVIMNSAVSS